MEKDALLIYIKAPYYHLPGYFEDNNVKISTYVRFCGSDSN
jgi:hypothetical protein